MFFFLNSSEFGKKNFHCILFILMLTSFLLAFNHNASRNVRKANGRLCLVDMLTTFARGSKCIHSDVLHIQFGSQINFHFWNDFNSCERCVASILSVKRRYANQTMHTGFVLQKTKGICSSNFKSCTLYTTWELALLPINNIAFTLVTIGPSYIHAHQHTSPILGFFTTLSRMDR